MKRIKVDDLPEVDLADDLGSEEEIAAFLAEAAKSSEPEVLARAQEYVALARAASFSEGLAADLDADNDDGAAAQAHLDAGRPIYVYDDEVQGMVRIWPDRRRELVEINDQGEIVVLRCLQ